MNKRTISATLALVGTLLASSTARADGVLVAKGALDAKARVSLEQAVKDAKAKAPKAFAEVAAVRASLAELDESKRGRLAVVTPSLKAIQGEAALALLSEIALDAKAQGSLPADAWKAWKLGLLEAVGALRDGRSAPALEAILDGEKDALVLRAAAEALGKLGTDAAVKKLGGLLKASGDKRLAAIAGLGVARRTAAVKLLAAELAALPKADEAKALAKALGDAGSAWAWRALKRTGQGVASEEGAARKAAARALVQAYAPYGGEARKVIQQAVLVVDLDETPQLVAEAKKGAAKDAQAALDELAAKFAATPLRK